MGSRCVARFPFVLAALAAALVAPARAEEPSARDLIDLAPVLDSADGRCRSLDISAYLGSEKDPAGPRLRFRALYRAPDQFSFLISDPADGTPLAFCSGRKIFIYDPIGPTVYYSEDGCCILEAEHTHALRVFRFKYDFLLKSKKSNHILVDLRSALPTQGPAAEGLTFKDRVVKHNDTKFELVRSFEKKTYLGFSVDLTKNCPYTAAAFVWDGLVGLRLDRLALNDEMGEEPFALPAKERLVQELPVRDVTAEEGSASALQMSAIVTRAQIARAFAHSAGAPGPMDIPGLSGVDWDRVKKSDKKLSKALRELVPPRLRAR